MSPLAVAPWPYWISDVITGGVGVGEGVGVPVGLAVGLGVGDAVAVGVGVPPPPPHATTVVDARTRIEAAVIAFALMGEESPLRVRLNTGEYYAQAPWD